MTLKELIEELRHFDDQDREVRIYIKSDDYAIGAAVLSEDGKVYLVEA